MQTWRTGGKTVIIINLKAVGVVYVRSLPDMKTNVCVNVCQAVAGVWEVVGMSPNWFSTGNV